MRIYMIMQATSTRVAISGSFTFSPMPLATSCLQELRTRCTGARSFIMASARCSALAWSMIRYKSIQPGTLKAIYSRLQKKNGYEFSRSTFWPRSGLLQSPRTPSAPSWPCCSPAGLYTALYIFRDLYIYIHSCTIYFFQFD